MLVLNGSREGLFFAAIAAERYVGPRRGKPAILVPNPFYPVYGAGARVGRLRDGAPVDRSGERLPARPRRAERRPARAHGRLLHRLAGKPARLGRQPQLLRQAEGARRPSRLPDLQRRVLLGNLHGDAARQHAGIRRARTSRTSSRSSRCRSARTCPACASASPPATRSSSPPSTNCATSRHRRCRCRCSRSPSPATATRRMSRKTAGSTG